MNSTIQQKELSKLLEAMVEKGKLKKGAAKEADVLPTPELQEEALDIFGDDVQVMRLIAEHLLNRITAQPAAAPPAPPPPPPMPSGASIAKAGLESFMGSVSLSFFSRAYSWLGDVALDLLNALEAMWKHWSWKRKILVTSAMLFVLSGFGIFQAIGTPIVWLYRHWHMPFVTHHQTVETPPPAPSVASAITPSAGFLAPPVVIATTASSAIHKKAGGGNLVVSNNKMATPAYRTGRSAAPMIESGGPLRNDGIQNTLSSRVDSENNTAATPQKKSGFLGSFAKHLVNNADMLVATAVPITPLAEGINATKDAALQASAEHGTQNMEASAEYGTRKPEGGSFNKDYHLPNSALRIPNSDVPVPAGLRTQMASPSKVHVSWPELGPEFTYNLYSSALPAMTLATKENKRPIHNPSVTWWSDEGPGSYYLAVTAIDAQGQESALSTPVRVEVSQ